MKCDLFKKKYFLGLVGLVFFFLIIKLPGMAFKFSDENIYFYMGKSILEGIIPYKDFFFASPPLQIAIISLIMVFIGKNLVLLKLIPIIASIISTIFLYEIVKGELNEKAALFSSALYLFSFVVLATTDHFTGIHLTTMFIIISLYFFLKNKPFLAGIISALALLTRLYSAIAIVGIVFYGIFKKRKSLMKYLSGVLSIFLVVNIPLILFFKNNYINSVFLYHLLKSEGISKINIFKFFLIRDFPILFLSLASLLVKNKKKLIFLIPAGAIILFYVFYADIYYLYLGLLVPFLAGLSGITLEKISRKSKKTFIVILIILGMILIFNSVLYLTTQMSTAKINFEGNLSNFIKENSNSGDKIYGSFEITPLVALLSGRKIANNYIDTNEKTFLTGIYNISNRTNNLRNNVKFVIMKVLIDNYGKIIRMDRIIQPEFLINECVPVKIYQIKKDYSDNAVIIWDCEKKSAFLNNTNHSKKM